MREDKINDIMNAEIRERMESDKWNLDISAGVLSKRKKAIKRNIITAALIPMAAIAVILLVSPPWNIDPPKTNELDQFIRTQVEGINREVFTENYMNSSSNHAGIEEILYDNIDILIDNTLAIR